MKKRPSSNPKEFNKRPGRFFEVIWYRSQMIIHGRMQRNIVHCPLRTKKNIVVPQLNSEILKIKVV